MPEPAYFIDTGQNVILNDSAEIAFGQKATLNYKVPANYQYEFITTFITGHRIPVRTPQTVCRIISIMLYKPKGLGGQGRPINLLGQGFPYWEELIGTAQLAFLLAVREQIAGGSNIEIQVENLDAQNAVTCSITLVGEIRETRTERIPTRQA